MDPSIVVTAAHCIDTGSLANARFVFGYEMQDADTAVTRIPDSEIYTGRRILGRAIGTEGTDWCVVQLDRPVLNHGYLPVRRSGKIADGAAVHVIGHPSGLPKKVAGGAAVRDNSREPVLRRQPRHLRRQLRLAGLQQLTHAGGRHPGARRDRLRPGRELHAVERLPRANGCRGEDVTRATEFAELVPAHENDFIPFSTAHAQVIEAGGRWKIEVDGVWLLDFADSKSEAERALKIIQSYGFNTQCFVGRPQPSMEFYLVDGQAPQGSVADEDVWISTPTTSRCARSAAAGSSSTAITGFSTSAHRRPRPARPSATSCATASARSASSGDRTRRSPTSSADPGMPTQGAGPVDPERPAGDLDARLAEALGRARTLEELTAELQGRTDVALAEVLPGLVKTNPPVVELVIEQRQDDGSDGPLDLRPARGAGRADARAA